MKPDKYHALYFDVLAKLKSIGWVMSYRLNPITMEFEAKWSEHGLEYAKTIVLERDQKLIGLTKPQLQTVLMLVQRIDRKFECDDILSG
jgi:hypothetical protein